MTLTYPLVTRSPVLQIVTIPILLENLLEIFPLRRHQRCRAGEVILRLQVGTVIRIVDLLDVI